MYRLYEKRDNQPVSMIFENPKSGESFTQFREMIKKSSRGEILQSKLYKKPNNYPGSSYMYNDGEGNTIQRPKSLIGASTMGSPSKSRNINKRNSNWSGKTGKNKNISSSMSNIIKPTVLGIERILINEQTFNEFLDIKKMIFKINFSKKKFMLEFDVLINQIRSKEIPQTTNIEKIRLEILFSDINQMDIFSELNEIKLVSTGYYVYKMYQENPKKPVYWQSANLSHLKIKELNSGETESTDVNDAEMKDINLKFTLLKDSTGKNLCARLIILQRLLIAGLAFSVDGRQQRVSSGAISLNLGQKFLPSRQDPSKSSFKSLEVRKTQKQPVRTSPVGAQETGLKQYLDKEEINALKNFENEIRIFSL